MDIVTSRVCGRSPIKSRQRPDMAKTVDWDVKHQFIQRNTKKNIVLLSADLMLISQGALVVIWAPPIWA